ncbi:MAG: hypothetical protein JRJ12_04540 [Deltaproteobacteria bacterium]|nr:hypothetical protein [Deltaproteobacteria bacterium]MBW2070475.1 hypothetical protein [Deltaproteobacteria bacterium]
MQVEMRSRGEPPDPKDIAQEILNGASFDRVQKKYGIKMRSQLLDLYSKGLSLLQEIPTVEPRGRRRQANVITTSCRRAIGASGTITLTRSLLLDELGFKEGDTFAISRRDNAIILDKID